jgi:hypothetical protein
MGRESCLNGRGKQRAERALRAQRGANPTHVVSFQLGRELKDV